MYVNIPCKYIDKRYAMSYNTKLEIAHCFFSLFPSLIDRRGFLDPDTIQQSGGQHNITQEAKMEANLVGRDL